MNRYIHIYIALACILSLYSCKPSTDKSTDKTEETEEHNHEHGENVIELSLDKAVAAGVKWDTISLQPFNSVIKTGGQILVAQGDESAVVASVAGIARLPKNLVEGTAVQKGQNVAALSSKYLQDGDPVLRARISYFTAKEEYDRVLPLAEKQIVTLKEFSKIKQEYENAKLSYEAISKNYSEKGQQIKSPLTGFVKSILVNEGDFVGIGQTLMTITQNQRLYLKAEVSERYYSQLKDINTAHFKSPYKESVYKLADLGGEVVSYGKSPATNEYLIPITFAFNNVGDIVPGSFVEVFLLSKTYQNSICLPFSAITEEQGLFFVYKKVCEAEYEKIEVKLGEDNGEIIQILSGIEPGDVIVTHGAQQIKLASASSSIPAHTHEH
ncbi:efflux RND transporter periplasmic adaptor subunit [Bacteroides propionicifaciens]|uniref:efflux RND transporter periplasmic adaptor subunit n=1 Tax=Bacteroides propionicifaciens TaxID=392838 RepID=UPI00035CBDE5|nr:efflux RND transporter periplasmic adaptor subunit [Bacteroides propionicifaciens]